MCADDVHSFRKMNAAPILPRVYPALDGLRAVAIVAVLISHFFPDRSLLQKSFHWGRFGVLLFFVLSGFLITGLLLRGRAAVDAGATTLGAVVRAFMARRALRIAPIYYMVVLVGWWVGYGPIADFLPWHLTYTGNIAMTYFDKSMAQATHLWSLCVEEQFYLLWPLVVLLAPARRLKGIAAGLVVFSFGYEAMGALQGRTFEQTHLVLQGCMDALGLGALLAIVSSRDNTAGLGAHRLSLQASLIGAPLFFFAQGFRYQVGLTATDRLAYRIPGDLGLALLSMSMVYLATSTGSSPMRSFLELAPVRFIGRISYGIYLYHLFLIPIGRLVAERLEVSELRRGPRMFLLYGGISVALAVVSWYAIEAPINRQKRRFPYPPEAAGFVPEARSGTDPIRPQEFILGVEIPVHVPRPPRRGDVGGGADEARDLAGAGLPEVVGESRAAGAGQPGVLVDGDGR
jgi:peptidoglycan/LPS O-acetylase OafA/YrhL